MIDTERPRSASWIGSLLGVTEPAELRRLLGLMALFFLVVCAVGILRPIKNSLALDGLGATDFYQVYLVSATVILFVPAFNSLADRLPWRALFAAVALFFALNLVAFRLLYVEGSALFGLLFYGWYDLFSAALVTQFFMATQFYFDSRSAQRAYPIVIAGGSIGATLGGGVTGAFAQSVGTPNLLIVAAALIAVFAFGIPWVMHGDHARPRRDRVTHGVAELFAHRQIRLIAAAVLLTVVVKQLVDYQFNTITKEIFVTRDAVSAFQGRFNAATQWLPLVVLAGLRPALRRWGVGLAVMLLPVLMLGATAALAITFGLAAAVAAKGADTSLRYSAERAGREILYVPVPEDIKLRAKAWIDVAVEKGIGKVVAALLIMVLLQFLDVRGIAWVSVALAAAWVVFALAIRREYVHTLAHAVEGRIASVRGVFATLIDATTLPLLRDSLHHPEPVRAAFGLELVGQLPDRDVTALAPALNTLLRHEREQIRHAAAEQLLRTPGHVDRAAALALLDDPSEPLRADAVRLLVAASDDATAVLRQLVTDPAAHVRIAALQALHGNGRRADLDAVRAAYAAARTGDNHADPAARAERALALGTLHDDDAAERVVECLDDPDPAVRSAALRSIALLGRADCADRVVAALGDRTTREAARDALTLLGTAALPALERALMDTACPPLVRRAVPATLARIPSQHTVTAMLRLVIAPETDQLLDYRTIRSLSQLRTHHAELIFPPAEVYAVAEAECAAAARYAAASRFSAAGDPARLRPPAALAHGDRVLDLLDAALREAWIERRDAVFRCLGLVLDTDAVERARAAVTRGSAAQRATAVEWIEQVIGPLRFRSLAAVLEPAHAPTARTTLEDLRADADPYIAMLARYITGSESDSMELIEKVFLLQQVDLLSDARGAHVALLASIAEELDVPAGTIILDEGVVAPAMYVVTRGSVELRGSGHQLAVTAGHAFGTWALIDDLPSRVQARSLESCRLLRVTRDDFHDLLADHPEIGMGMLRGLARRMRALVA
jgi:AAA family ATP:ADP antiporter